MNLTVNIDKKSIQTEPIRRLMIQGEALVDVVGFALPLEYGDLDLSALNYSIRATSEDSETTATQVLSKTVTSTAVNLEWAVSAVFTAISGELKLVLVGSDEAGETIIKLDGESVYVRADPSLAGFATAPISAYEQLLAQVNYAIAHAQVVRILGTYATLEALDAAIASPLMGDMYNVGSAIPYTVYVWQDDWVSLGVIEGKDGDQGEPGAVDTTIISMINNGGVFSGGAVTAQGTPNQTVAVSAGSVLTPEGKPYTFNALTALAASAADATNPRIDIVYVSGAGDVTYLAGTAALSPAHPATPANGTLLASVTRAAGDNTIATADIIDERAYTLWTKGRTVNVFGDSQSDTGVKASAWPSLLPARLGVSVNNYAVSGKQIGGATGFAATMATYTAAADINLVMCGINDYWGSRAIGKSSSVDTGEFYGAVNVMFKYISEHWPRALNCVILGPRVQSYNTGTYGTDRLYQYIEYKVAKKYGFLVIDLYNALPNYNPAIAALKTLYCSDGMHADSVYQPTIADIVANYIANKRCDSFPPATFDVSAGCTIVASGGSSAIKVELDTNDFVHLRYTGVGLPANNIVSYHVNLATIPSFCYSEMSTLMHVAGSLALASIYGILAYNNASVGFDYYSSTTDPFNISVCASWKAGYI